MRHSRLAAIVVCAALAPAAAFAGWSSVGAVSAPTREGDSLVFRGAQGIAAVSVLGPEAIRVRFSPTKEFEEHAAIVEKYDIERRESDVSAGIRFGYAANQVGFGWTNGAYLDLLAGLDAATP